MTPFSIVIPTRNSAAFLQRTLASVEKVMAGRRWALIIADDGSTDGTVEIARRHFTTASTFSVERWSKAPNIATAKNRAMSKALLYRDWFPYITLLDSDDELLPGRIALVERAAQSCAQVAAADYIEEMNGSRSVTSMPQRLPGHHHGAWACVYRHDAIPEGGLFDATAGDGHHDDQVAMRRLAQRGQTIRWFDVEPHVLYHHRGDSFFHSGKGGVDRTAKTRQWLLENQVVPFCDAASFIAVGRNSMRELAVAIKTFRRWHPSVPVIVFTDLPEDVAKIGATGVECRDSGLVLSGPDSMMAKYTGPDHARNLFRFGTAKLHAAHHLILDGFHRAALFDSDLIFTGPLGAAPDGKVLVAPNTIGGPRAHNWSWYSWGMISAGIMRWTGQATEILTAAIGRAHDNIRLHKGHKDYTPECSTFAEQGALDWAQSRSSHFWPLHPGHNLTPALFDQHDLCLGSLSGRELVAEGCRLSGLVERDGLWIDGWPVVSIHTHLWSQGWNKGFARFIREHLASMPQYEGLLANESGEQFRVPNGYKA